MSKGVTDQVSRLKKYKVYDTDVETSKTDYLRRQKAQIPQEVVGVKEYMPVISRKRDVSQIDTKTSSNENRKSLRTKKSAQRLVEQCLHWII